MITLLSEYECEKQAAEAIHFILRELRAKYPKQEHHRRLDFARQIARQIVKDIDNA